MTTTTTTTTEDLQSLLEEYEQCVNIPITPYIARCIAQWMKDGMQYDDIMYALHETAGAPRPSWKYADAILRRIKAERQGARPRRVQPFARTTAEQQYEQRPYEDPQGMPEWMAQLMKEMNA